MTKTLSLLGPGGERERSSGSGRRVEDVPQCRLCLIALYVLYLGKAIGFAQLTPRPGFSRNCYSNWGILRCIHARVRKPGVNSRCRQYRCLGQPMAGKERIKYCYVIFVASSHLEMWIFRENTSETLCSLREGWLQRGMRQHWSHGIKDKAPLCKPRSSLFWGVKKAPIEGLTSSIWLLFIELGSVSYCDSACDICLVCLCCLWDCLMFLFVVQYETWKSFIWDS